MITGNEVLDAALARIERLACEQRALACFAFAPDARVRDVAEVSGLDERHVRALAIEWKHVFPRGRRRRIPA